MMLFKDLEKDTRARFMKLFPRAYAVMGVSADSTVPLARIMQGFGYTLSGLAITETILNSLSIDPELSTPVTQYRVDLQNLIKEVREQYEQYNKGEYNASH